MLRLKNIEIDNNIISCEIFPEDSVQSGKLKVDINSQDIISYTLPAGFEWCKSHVHHAKKYLLSNLKEILHTPIHDKIVMWY